MSSEHVSACAGYTKQMYKKKASGRHYPQPNSKAARRRRDRPSQAAPSARRILQNFGT